MASGFKSPRIPTKSSKPLSIANATAFTEQMELVFSEIEDPRAARTRVHALTDILIIGILSAKRSATPCGVRRRKGMGRYGELWIEQI
jgi:hypothetical protein